MCNVHVFVYLNCLFVFFAYKKQWRNKHFSSQKNYVIFNIFDQIKVSRVPCKSGIAFLWWRFTWNYAFIVIYVMTLILSSYPAAFSRKFSLGCFPIKTSLQDVKNLVLEIWNLWKTLNWRRFEVLRCYIYRAIAERSYARLPRWITWKKEINKYFRVWTG